MDIEGTTIAITGGGAGIGAAMARRFHTEGALSIIVLDRDIAAASEVAGTVDGEAIELDVAQAESNEQVFSDIIARYGHIDLLCLNAGIPTGGSVDASDADWQLAWEVNVMAHVWATRAVLPSMLDHGSGHILVTASAAGLLTNIGAAPYSATKHAAVALAEWMAVTYGRRGIGVSCLCPQFVDTAMLGVFDGFDPAMREWVSQTAISVDDVANSVVEGLRDERFLILPHPEVADYVNRRATDRDGWIESMRGLQEFLRYEP